MTTHSINPSLQSQHKNPTVKPTPHKKRNPHQANTLTENELPKRTSNYSPVPRETIRLLQRRRVSRETFREISAKSPMTLHNIPASLSLIDSVAGKRLYSLKLWQPGRVKWTTCFRDLPFAWMSFPSTQNVDVSRETRLAAIDVVKQKPVFHVKHGG